MLCTSLDLVLSSCRALSFEDASFGAIVDKGAPQLSGLPSVCSEAARAFRLHW